MPAAAHIHPGLQFWEVSQLLRQQLRATAMPQPAKGQGFCFNSTGVMNPLLPKTLAALAHICPRSRPLSLQTHLHNSASSSASVRRLKASAGTAVKLAERVKRDSKAELLCAVEPLASSMPPTAWACQCQTPGARTSQGQRSKH